MNITFEQQLEFEEKIKSTFNIKYTDNILKINYLKIPVTQCDTTIEGAKFFNEVFNMILPFELNIITRTQSKGISIDRRYFKLPMWDTPHGRGFVEICYVGQIAFRLQFRTAFSKLNGGVSGRKAYATFRKKCEELGIDLDSLAITNGKEVKATIPPALIGFESGQYATKDKTLTNMNHIDFNSAWPYGCAKDFPVLKPAYQYFYDHRKDKDKNGDLTKFAIKCKAILNETNGFFQSDVVGCKFAHIAKAGIVTCNKLVEDMAQKLRDSGRQPILYNTDGIWYQGEVYHDENEGTEMGQYKNDHVNCTFRWASKGVYEFIEDGKYTPKLRGRTMLDKVKPRDQWQWGDIYQDGKTRKVIVFEFNENKGLVEREITL